MTTRLLPIVLFLACSSALHGTQDGPLTSAEWRSDLGFLAEEIREEHRNPFHSVEEEVFEAAVNDLHDAIPTLDEHEIVAGLAKIVALLKDGHTRLTLPVDHEHLGFYQGHSIDPPAADRLDTFHTLPVRFYLFNDGLHVISATADHHRLLGAKVLSIGVRTSEEALEAIQPYVAAENDSGLKLVAPTRLGIPELLAASGITEDPARTPLRLQRQDGEEFEVSLPALDAETEVEWLDARERTGAALPLWLKDSDAFYWFEPLPENEALYVQINQFDDDRSPDETAGQFTRRVFRYVEEHEVERIVVDLRHNTGGDATYLRPFVLGLVRWSRISEPGSLFVLTGRKTFSAAILLVNELEYYTHATFVGEPIGGTPNHYGDSRRTRLPASGLTLRTSRVYWREWSGAEDRPFFLSLPASMSAADYAFGRDPALQAALSFRPASDLGEALIEADRLSGINSALFLAHRLRSDPATADESTEAGMIRYARFLAKEKRHRHAAYIFTIVREGYPESVAAHLGEAQARLALEDLSGARDAAAKALTLEPANALGEELLAQAEAAASEK